jgi:hypothetical protein
MEIESASTSIRDVHSVVAKHATKDVVKHFVFIVATDDNCITFVPTVPVMHTIRTAFGSFFLYTYGQ